MVRAILSRPGTVALAVALTTAGLGVFLPSLRVDNTPEIWLPTDLEGLETYREFRDRFGDDSLILAFASDLEGEPDQAAWTELTSELGRVPGVADVIAPGFVETEDGLSPPIRHYLTSEDGAYAGIVLVPEADLEPASRGRLVEELESLLGPWSGRIGEFRLAGADVVTYDLDVASQQSLGGLSPIVFAVMCLVLYLATREWRAVAAGLTAIVVVSLWSLSLLAAAGRPMNLVLAVMPAILAVVTIAQAMHLLSRFQSLSAPGEPSRERRIEWWASAMRATWKPCWLCALTTAAGFASLGASEIPPVRDLGVFTAVGVLLSLGLCFTLFPAWLATSSAVLPQALHGRRRRVYWTAERARAFGEGLRRRSAAVLLCGALVFATALVGVGKLQLESHILTFFPPDHRTPQNYRTVEAHLTALTPFELILSGDRGTMLAPETMRAYRDALESALREEPILRQAVSVLLEPTGETDLEFVIPPEDIAEVFRDEEIPESLRALVQAEGDRLTLRTTLLATTESSNACHALAERLRPRFRAALPETVETVLTGGATLLIEGQVLLLDTQIRSFALALAVITLVILIAFRSPTLVAISLLPNLLPVVLTLGLMGFAGIPLNTATVTVAGIALGLIVDDTIHFLHHYHARRGGGRDPVEAVAETLFEVGRPAFITTAAVALGFGVFALAPFRPTLFFGLLIAAAATVAMVCDFVLLPAALQLRSRRVAALHSEVRR